MKKVIRLTESQLEEIVRRVIAEQKDEQEDYKHPWTEEQLQYHEDEAKKIFNSPVSADKSKGENYCFSKKQDQNSVMEELKRSVRTSGSEGKSLYKIKSGDTPDGIKMMSSNYLIEDVNSKSCDMNRPRVGDVILIRK